MNSLRLGFAVAALSLFAGCPGEPIKPPDDLPPLPSVALPLPRTADGKFILIEIGKSAIDLDPTLKDPLTALGGCADLVTKCYAPDSKSLDACVEEAKSCETQRPWEALRPCCPTACKTSYAQARSTGSEEFAAFDAVFFQDPSCFPGVTALIGGAP